MPLQPALLVALGALAAGLVVAWAITLIPGFLYAAEPTPTPTPTPSVTVPEGVTVPTLAPILRDLDDSDRAAGITTVNYTYQGSGSFTTLSGTGEPDSSGAPVRWVSIAVEDGIEAYPAAFAGFVLSALADNRSWGSDDRLQFVQTDGVADYTIKLASPFTAAAICADNHVAVVSGPVTEASESPPADIEATQAPGLAGGDDSGSDGATSVCAANGEIVISIYEWTAGFEAFGPDHDAARKYLLNHHMGHLFGRPETECAAGRADVMDNQRGSGFPCDANSWPYPDAAVSDPSQPGGMPPTSPSP